MMKGLLIFCLLLVAISAMPNDHNKYTTKYDNIDLEEILTNHRLFENYFKCLMGGKCTADGAELRDALPDALATACSKCSEKQKVGTEKVIRYMLEKKPAEYDELEKKYDPQGTYKAKYQAEAEKRGIKV